MANQTRAAKSKTTGKAAPKKNTPAPKQEAPVQEPQVEEPENDFDLEVAEEEVQFTGITLTRERFKQDYAIVTDEGFYKLLVSSVSPEIPMVNRHGEQVLARIDDRPLTKHIINLKAIPYHHLQEVRELWQGRDEIDVAELRGKTMSVNAPVPVSGEVDLPFNGQRIGVQTGYVENSEEEMVLVGTAYKLPAAKKAMSFTFEDEEEDEIESPEA